MFNRGSAAYKSSSSLGGSVNRHPLSLCADCGGQGPTFASINRGVLLCTDCASVHRSLGRHISHVKSLRGSPWIPEQLTMVQSLYSCGANSIWEYSLLNPAASGSGSKGSSKRSKPSATDPVHPIKADFIVAKYQQLSFVYKPAKDDAVVTQSELSRQLHSSVRTPNLETSLRLLSQGADPNYYHPEKNSTPLQVSARAGQSGQIELLLVYGADPGAVDKMGRTAAHYAKESGHSGLATRIKNAQFELSDRLTFFLCQKRPEHSQGQHFLVPDLPQQDVNTNDRKVAKRKLQGLNNSVFEELAMDVFDEVDRRETDVVWANQVESSSAKSIIIPFLPVNPEYGTTRNQGRQKLARLNQNEFAVLVLDVLKEIKRRQTEMNSHWPSQGKASPLREVPPGSRSGDKVGHTKSLPIQRLMVSSTFSDDEPIYDHVASDDDYYHLPDESKKRPESSDGHSTKQDLTITTGSSITSSPSKSNASSSNANATNFATLIGPSEFKEMKDKLESSEEKVQKLIKSNDDMRSEIARLSEAVNKLMNENESLRTSINLSNPNSQFTSQLIRGEGGNNSVPYADGSSRYTPSPVQRHFGTGPRSMPSSTGNQQNFMTLPSRYTSGRSGSGGAQQSQSHYYEPYDQSGPSLNSSDHGSNSNRNSNSLPYTLPQQQQQQQQSSHQKFADSGDSQSNSSTTGVSPDLPLPSQEEVVRRTEAITRCIQELLISAKDEKFDAFIPCSERIVRAVTDMVVLFPEEPIDSSVSAALTSLTAAATHFETECRILIVRSQSEPLQQSFVTQQVIQCAFDIAKSTKQLVALFQ